MSVFAMQYKKVMAERMDLSPRWCRDRGSC